MVFGRKKEKKIEKENKKLSESVISLQCLKPVLGVSLKTAINNDKCFDGILIPAVVRYCIDYVNSFGLEQEGIYRVSPNKSRLDELEAFVNSDDDNKIPKFTNCHEASGLLKRFLRQLPEHILTSDLVLQFEAAASKCKCDVQKPCKCCIINEFKILLEKLPRENYFLLAYVFWHAQNIIHKEHLNKMGIPALGVLLQAILNLSRNTVRIFLLNASNSLEKNITKIFEDVEYKTYEKPKTFKELKECIFDDAIKMREELYKQYNLLRHLQEMFLLPIDLVNYNYKNNQRELSEVKEAIYFLEKKLDEEGITYQKQYIDENLFKKNICPILEYNKNTTNLFVNNNDAETNFVLLEKQLIAVQSTLKEEIANEKRKITQLLSQLREIHDKLSPDEKKQLKIFRQKNSVNDVQTSLFSTNNKIFDIESTNIEEQQYNYEIKKRDDLIEEIKRLRNLCAELRAHLEHDTVLINNSNSQSASFISSIFVNNNPVNEFPLNTSPNFLLKEKEDDSLNLLKKNSFSSNQKIKINLNPTKSDELLITRF